MSEDDGENTSTTKNKYVDMLRYIENSTTLKGVIDAIEHVTMG